MQMTKAPAPGHTNATVSHSRKASFLWALAPRTSRAGAGATGQNCFNLDWSNKSLCFNQPLSAAGAKVNADKHTNQHHTHERAHRHTHTHTHTHSSQFTQKMNICLCKITALLDISVISTVIYCISPSIILQIPFTVNNCNTLCIMGIFCDVRPHIQRLTVFFLNCCILLYTTVFAVSCFQDGAAGSGMPSAICLVSAFLFNGVFDLCFKSRSFITACLWSTSTFEHS